jgi:hypothetical protein
LGVYLYDFLMLTLDGDEWSASYTNLFHFWGKILRYPLKMGCVGPRTRLNTMENRNISRQGSIRDFLTV